MAGYNKWQDSNPGLPVPDFILLALTLNYFSKVMQDFSGETHKALLKDNQT